MEYGWHLDNTFTDFYEQIPDREEKGYTVQNREEVKEKISLFETEWKKYEEKILESICRILGLEFYKKVIDVYIVGAYKKAFSTPMVISAKYEPDLFVDIITHELLHVLLTDNDKNVSVGEIWKEMFPEAIDRTSLNHVLVHAVHKQIYLDTLNTPERFERDLKRCGKWPSYNDAWNIVEKEGYLNIIERFKKYY